MTIVIIDEKDSSNMQQFMNKDVTVKCVSGRTNWFTIDDNIVVKDVRMIFFSKKGSISLHSWNNDDKSDETDVQIKKASTIYCNGVYWSKKVNVE